MSKTDGNITGLWGNVVRGRGVGSQTVVPKENRTMTEEAEYFHKMYDGRDDTVDGRKKDATRMVDTFYDLVTDFYESGWGQSFHFAPRGVQESFRESIVRHEHYIAAKLKIEETDHVLDAGCGIGGPMRNIVQFTGAKVTGITINAYQVKRGNAINKQVGLAKKAKLVENNYLKMSFPDNTFDKCFAIESTCHAAQRVEVFREIFRVLKPGGLFASYEWVVNSNYDPKNPAHVKARQQIEKGNALPELILDKECDRALEKAGFELVEGFDLAEKSTQNGQLPWYGTLQAKCSLENITQSYAATLVTHALCWTMETVGLAPKGTLRTHEFLLEGRDGLVAAGEMNIFTPMYVLVGRKPAKE